MKIRLLTLLLLALFAACRPEPKLPKWDREALAPLLHTRIGINDMVSDSNLTVGPNGTLSLVYQEHIAHLQPNEIFEPLNEEYHNVINLQSIDLGSPFIKESISLGELSKGGSPAGQFIIFNNGQVAMVPVFPVISNKKFNVDATNLFQTITLDSGKTTLELKNELPVALTNIQFQLRNEVSGTVIISDALDTLHAGQTWSQNYSLNNVTIEGSLEAELVKFDSPGSGTNQVLIDTTDKIWISVRLSDLVPNSATAIFPQQNLANDTTVTSVKTGNADLTSILVNSGGIFLDAESTIEDEIKLDYTIPNASKNGATLGFNEVLPPAPPSSFSNSYTTVDLSGYKVDLTGKPTDFNVYNSFYTILVGRIDSTGNLVHLSLDDSVALRTGTLDLTASEGYGYLGKDTIEGIENTKVDVFGTGNTGSFELKDVLLGLRIENNIGAPIDVHINSFTSKQNGGDVALTWPNLGQAQQVPAATLGSNNQPIPGKTTLAMDANNSNIDKLIENKPESFETDYAAYINGSTNTPDYSQFIFTDFGVDVYMNMEIPLELATNQLILADTSEFSYADIDPDNQLKGGALKIIAENLFPLELTIDLQLLDARGNLIGTITSSDVIAPAVINNGEAIEATKSIANYPLNDESIEWLKDAHSLVFNVSLTSPNTPDRVKIMDRNYLDLILSGDLTIRNR